MEQYTTTYRFENDGTWKKTTSGRYRVQSEAALQGLGQLVFGYSSDTERLKIDYVRVLKSNGTVVTAPESAVQDLTSEVARQAPVYSDFRQKHVTVPSLRPGEVLEFQTTTETFQPLAPGQFWMDHSFEKTAITLDEVLVVDMPRNRQAKVKVKPGFEGTQKDEGERRIFRWEHKNLERPDDDRKAAAKALAKRRKEMLTADVQMTTFASWSELAKWYSGLEQERRKPDEAIRTKAAELTKDKTTDREKIEAIYDFVATQFRYVSLSFGTGRYQPHAAAEVFAAQYGDCKDKHTLLASMLSAIGFTTDTALIHSMRKLDEDVPSPSQFDHVISAVRLGGKRIWLDTTSEVAPFEVLLANLRGKDALLITPEATGEVVKTPQDLPFTASQKVDITGKISPLGKLDVHVKYELRGDSEVILRASFRQIPETRWVQLLQMASEIDGLEGDVSNPKVSSPSATREPFIIEYDLTRANFLNISSKKSELSLPMVKMRLDYVDDEDDESSEPIKFGSPLDALLTLRLEIPEKYKLRTPLPVTMKREYGEYSSSYAIAGNALTVKRQLKVNVNELPVAKRSDLQSFARVMQNDTAQQLGVEGPGEAEASEAASDAKAEDLDDAAYAALRERNYKLAASLYKRVVELEPKHKTAWNNLGRAYMDLMQLDDAEKAIKKQIEINPYDEWSYNNLGLVYQRQEKYEEAISAFKKQIEVNPLDRYAHRNLGMLLSRRHRYEEAVPELQQAMSIQPDDLFTQQQLGDAYLKSGQSEKALETFDEVVKKMPVAPMWNNVAYALAEQGVHLEKARQYAESAVFTTASALQTLPEDRLTEYGAVATASLVTYWDTLGWVYFKQGSLDQAEKYISAAWNHGQHGEVADHLAQIYEARGLKEKAMTMYAKALAAPNPVPETRARLAKLLGDDKKVDPLVNKMRGVISEERTVHFGQQKIAEGGLKVRETTADFMLVFGADAKLATVKFIKGSDALKDATEKLKEGKFSIEVPDGKTSRLVRNAVMSCSKATTDCALVLVPAGDQITASAPIPLTLFSTVPQKEPAKDDDN